MAGRRRGTFKPPNGDPKPSYSSNEIEDPCLVYEKIISTFPEEPGSNSIQKWMNDIIDDLVLNPQRTVCVCKYLLLFSHLKSVEKSIGSDVRRCLLQLLESSYNAYVKGESEPIKYRNFTYFFGASINFMWMPMSIPLNKDLMSALLILISKLDIMEDFEDSLVYSKCVFWLSRYITHDKVNTIVLNAYEEALSRLRELISSGRGSLVSLACLEAAINGGKLNKSGVNFYCKSLSKIDFLDITEDFTIIVPEKDKNKYDIKNLNVVFK